MFCNSYFLKSPQLRQRIYLGQVKHIVYYIIIYNLFKNISRQILQINFKLTEILFIP